MSLSGAKWSNKFYVTNNGSSDQHQDNGPWLPLYEPAYGGVEIEHDNLASPSSGRTVNGVMRIDFIKGDIVKVGLKWSYLTESEIGYIKEKLQGKQFKFKYYDCGEMNEMFAYCGKIKYTMVSTNYQGTGTAMYKDISANIIDRSAD